MSFVIAIMSKQYSTYRYVKNDMHFSTSLLVVFGFILVETGLMADFALNVCFTHVLVYASYFSISFWLRRICTDEPKSGTSPGTYQRILLYQIALHYEYKMQPGVWEASAALF